MRCRNFRAHTQGERSNKQKRLHHWRLRQRPRPRGWCLYVVCVCHLCPLPVPFSTLCRASTPGPSPPRGKKIAQTAGGPQALPRSGRMCDTQSKVDQCTIGTKGFASGTKQIHAVVMVFKISTSSNTTLSKRVGSSSLDPSSFRGDLRKRRQVAIFLTTHDHYAAQDRCPRACWLGRGLCALGCPGPAYQVCRVVHADAG